MKRYGSYFLLTLLLLPGCASSLATKQIATFATATTVAADNAAAAYESVEESYYEIRVAELTLNFDKEGFNPERIDRFHFLSDEDRSVRLQLLQGLKVYAQKLAEIMSDRQLEAFDEETRAFGRSLADLSNNPALKTVAARVDGRAVGIFTTAVDALGNWLIRYKRQRDLQPILADMQKPLSDICRLLIEDIGRAPDKNGADGSGGLRDQLWRQYSQMLMTQDGLVRRLGVDDPLRNREIARLPELVRERQAADAALAATQEALRKLVATHDQLVQAFHGSSPRLDQLLLELRSEGARIASYYRTLRTE